MYNNFLYDSFTSVRLDKPISNVYLCIRYKRILSSYYMNIKNCYSSHFCIFVHVFSTNTTRPSSQAMKLNNKVNRTQPSHSFNRQKWLLYQILDGKTVKNVQIGQQIKGDIAERAKRPGSDGMIRENLRF